MIQFNPVEAQQHIAELENRLELGMRNSSDYAPDEILMRRSLGKLESAVEYIAGLETGTLTPDGTALLLHFRDKNEALEAEVARLNNLVESAITVHVKSAFWVGEDESMMTDEDGEETEPKGYVCLTCSDDHIESDLENWNFDESDTDAVFWPCPTVRALAPAPAEY